MSSYVFSFGADSAKYESPEPIILISGFMCSPLFENFGEENETKVWGPNSQSIISALKENVKSVGKSLFKGTSALGEEIGKTINQVLSPLECLPNGSSKKSLKHYENNPGASNISYMLETDEGKYLYEIPFCTYLNSISNGKNIFCFEYDSRLPANILADELSEFIDAVLEYTGQKKVKLFALSYGGLICASYFYKYGSSLVCDAVLSVPALGGTDLVWRILRGNIDIKGNAAIKFFETASRSTAEFSSYFKNLSSDTLNELLSAICSNVGSIVKNWGSIWCLCRNEYYEELKADFLDSEENAELIENTDYVHYNIMANMQKILKKCRESGTAVSIICGEGTPLALGGSLNGDLVLPASGVSGATVCDIGEKFDENYLENATLNYISPDNTIDASTCYLPDNTFFVKNHYHGQYYYESYTRSLVTKLLFTDEIKDIYSSAAFTQFASSDNQYKTISVSFNNSETGFISADSCAIKIKNIGEKCKIKVLKIQGDESKFKSILSGLIGEGEEIEIPFENHFDYSSNTHKITVTYLKIGALHPVRKAEFIFGTES